MNDPQRLHEEAMELADRATVEKMNGATERAAILFREAYEKERLAALALSSETAFEPSRSVLFRSASSLALECGEIREAERLIAAGLAGNPPEEISEELRDLLEKVYFMRHLKLRGISLREDEVQMSLTGNAVGLGITESKEFYTRITDVESMVFRTAERLLGEPYKDRGRRKEDLKRTFELYISEPRAASFAVTFKIGGDPQLELPGIGLSGRVIDEILELLELFEKSEERMLSERIGNEAYLRNFFSLARRISPDGDRIKTVGFTAYRDNKERQVVVTRRRKAAQEVSEVAAVIEEQRRTVTIRGNLRYADELADHHEIRIVDSNETAHRIIVPEGMMDDIVRPMWHSEVIIKGIRREKVIELESIDPVEE
jgi:hypothetical protein